MAVFVKAGYGMERAVIEYQWTQASAYDSLARFHYRAGKPATIAKRLDGGPAVIAAMACDEVIGVLIASMPTLNGSWRNMPWPGRFDAKDKRAAACKLNSEVRCLSRVVVDPRWRGRGIAVGMVRWYLEHSLSVRTEAVAAMGRYCPFFERAGMTAYPMGPRLRDARLLDAINAAGLGALDLLMPDRVNTMLERTPWIADELTRWAKSCRSTRSRTKEMNAQQIALIAGGVVSAPLTGYAHTNMEMHTSTKQQGAA